MSTSLFAAIHSPRPTVWVRAVCMAMCACLLFTSYASGFHAAGEEIVQAMRHIMGRKGEFTDKPGPIYRGPSPGRDPLGRGGMWTPQLLRDLDGVRRRERMRAPLSEQDLYASLVPGLPVVSAMLQTGDPPGGGDGPGEGGGPGGGSTGSTSGTTAGSGSDTGGGSGSDTGGTGSTSSGSTGGMDGSSAGGGAIGNTNTGNRHVAYGIVGWSALGQNGVGFVLHHNSLSDYSFDLGSGWSHSYDVKIDHTIGSSAIIRYGDGLEVPYTESSGTFTPPAGYHDDLVLNGGGTWTITTKHQWVYDFDTDGRLVAVTDQNGNTTTISRNGSGKITTISDGVGRDIDFTYTMGGLIETVTDPLNRLWTFVHDGSNDLVEIEYPSLDSTIHDREFGYDSDHNITTETDRRGKTWTFTYDTSERLTSFTNPLSKTWTYTYGSSSTTITNPLSKSVVHNYSSGMLASVVDASTYSDAYVWDGDKNLTQYTDKRGKVWEYTYDGNGNMLTAEDPLSNVTEYTYDGSNRLTDVENALGKTWSATYDGNGNMLTVTDPLSRTAVTNTYTTDGDIATTKDALNRTTSFDYDGYGNLIEVTDPASISTYSDHNLLGWVIETTDAAGSDYQMDYDEWGRLVEVTEPGSVVSSLVYDEEGNTLSGTNGLGKTGYRAYDDLGRLTSTTNAESEVQSYGYNDANFLTSITNGRSYTRTYTYTDRGDVASLTLPDSSVESWSYNANGQVSAYTNPLSQVINYVYDDAGRQTGVDYPTGTDTAFNYDNASRTTSMVDSTGTSSWTYNDANEVTQLTTPQGTLNYTYNSAGQRATMVETGVGTTTYTYDTYGRLSTIENPFSEVTTLTYDTAGRVSKKTFDSGVYDQYTYDARSRVTDIDTKNSSHTALAERSYTYNAISQVTQLVEGTVTTTYTYDDIGQLTGESKTSGYAATYTYDANGNRATRTVNSVTETYTYDAGDKLTAITGGADPRTFGYDSAGRTTSISRSGGTDVTTLAYDYESRVTSISRPGHTTNTFSYNGLNTRVGKTDSMGSSSFHRDGVLPISPSLGDGSTHFTPGTSERRSGATTFLHSAIKNVDIQTNSLQALASVQEFSAFGEVIGSSGSPSGPFGYAGRVGYHNDEDHGLQHLGNRYYDRSIGRFITRDFARDGRNWYSYCDNNPIRNSDPSGLMASEDWVVFVLDIGGVFEPTPFCDISAGLIESSRGNHLDAGLSFAGVIPYAGDVGKVGKYVRRGGRWIDEAGQVMAKGSIDKHHVIPQAISKLLGFDHDLFRFTVPLPKDVHKGLHGGKGLPHPGGWYNNMFYDMIEQVGDIPDVTEEIVEKWFRDVMARFNW